MEAYSVTQAMEAVPVEPVAEWPEPGGGTGLEEPMSQLGLGGGPESYPEKPDEPDCIYYLRTGRCGYGNRCRFNHPRDRSAAMGALWDRGGEYPERFGQPLCQYYMRTGLCKFGASCKYHHPRLGVGFSAAITLNYYGYPLRPGEKECSYYVKTGQCKFGVTCKFHHPMPSELQVPTQAPTPGHGPLATPVAVPTPAVYPTVQSPSIQASQQYGILPGNWPDARAAMLPGSYVPGSYGHMLFPPGVVPIPGWTPYQAPGSPMASPSTRPTIGASPTYGMTQLPPSGTAYTGPYLPSTSAPGPSGSNLKENAFPARPGQPECPYYLRTGHCKFGSMCKYHHPPELSAARSSFLVSPIGLPLRPGALLCSHYAQNGVCEFGLSCKFDHPMRTLSYSSSASSLTDIPVAPYPVGSTSATLAPSSSSSDLRPELLSVSGKHAFTSHMSSMNSSSASIGSIISHSGHAPQSSFQHSVQSSTSSRVASSMSYGGQVCTSS